MPQFESHVEQALRNRSGRLVVWFRFIMPENSQSYMLQSYHPERADDGQQTAMAEGSLENTLNFCRTEGIKLLDFDEILKVARQVHRESGIPAESFVNAAKAQGGFPINVRDLVSGQMVTIRIDPVDDQGAGPG